MSVLLRAELAKLMHNKWLVLLLIVFSAAYIWMTVIYYQWNDAISWERIARFPYSAGAVFQGMIVVFSLSVCFAREYQEKTAALLFSTRNGRSKLTWAKITASLLLITAVVTGFWLLNLGINLWLAGAEGWDLPIQRLEGYESSPYSLLIWQYVLVQAATNWLGCIAFALFTLFLSARIRSYLTVFFLSGIVFVMPFFIRNSSELSATWIVKYGPMIELMRVVNIYNRPRHVEAGDWVVSLPLPVFYIHVLLLAVGFLWWIFHIMRQA